MADFFEFLILSPGEIIPHQIKIQYAGTIDGAENIAKEEAKHFVTRKIGLYQLMGTFEVGVTAPVFTPLK